MNELKDEEVKTSKFGIIGKILAILFLLVIIGVVIYC